MSTKEREVIVTQPPNTTSTQFHSHGFHPCKWNLPEVSSRESKIDLKKIF